VLIAVLKAEVSFAIHYIEIKEQALFAFPAAIISGLRATLRRKACESRTNVPTQPLGAAMATVAGDAPTLSARTAPSFVNRERKRAL
jgi:hypothetical protein